MRRARTNRDVTTPKFKSKFAQKLKLQFPGCEVSLERRRMGIAVCLRCADGIPCSRTASLERYSNRIFRSEKLRRLLVHEEDFWWLLADRITRTLWRTGNPQFAEIWLDGIEPLNTGPKPETRTLLGKALVLPTGDASDLQGAYKVVVYLDEAGAEALKRRDLWSQLPRFTGSGWLQFDQASRTIFASLGNAS